MISPHDIPTRKSHDIPNFCGTKKPSWGILGIPSSFRAFQGHRQRFLGSNRWHLAALFAHLLRWFTHSKWFTMAMLKYKRINKGSSCRDSMVIKWAFMDMFHGIVHKKILDSIQKWGDGAPNIFSMYANVHNFWRVMMNIDTPSNFSKYPATLF